MDRVRKQIGVPVSMVNTEHPVTVAVLDTGIARHPDLSGQPILFMDFVYGRKDSYDDNGHGTHVCGIIAGDGKLSKGRYRGIAPGACLVAGKILDRYGNGDVASLINGLRWILELSEKRHIDMINISIGMSDIRDIKKLTEVQELVDEVWRRGILIVCAAGNNGPKTGSLSRLCYTNKIISVGCHDGAFYQNNSKSCQFYSARGEYSTRKPDLVAPGTEIISCSNQYDIRSRSNRFPVAKPYVSKSGTSMATAIVSGCLALYIQKHGVQPPDYLRKKLLENCQDLQEIYCMQGWGMVNIGRMLAENEKRH